jgi:hypothetical protein
MIFTFLHPKKVFESQNLSSDQETNNMQDWLKGLAADLFDSAMLKLAAHYDESLIYIAATWSSSLI